VIEVSGLQNLMQLNHGIHLAYCTNVHRGGDWEETFHSLEHDVLRVRQAVSPDAQYAIGLRLSANAANELSDSARLLEFQRWLEEKQCYVFTINGFPYGDFHGTRVKEQVYVPDWSKPERLEYTNLLFDILSEILPPGVPGSVSTLPGSFKEFYPQDSSGNYQVPNELFDNLLANCKHIEKLCAARAQDLHLGLEPEPLGLFETSEETVKFLDQLQHKVFGDDTSWQQRIGVNYDTCHLGVEFEEPETALSNILNAGYRISKIHISSALSLHPNKEVVQQLSQYSEPVYLHQVISRNASNQIQRWKDLDLALQYAEKKAYKDLGEEWRVHFHVPLHAAPGKPFSDTREHVYGTLDYLELHPDTCQHLEMETYTWEVLPKEIRTGDVVDQVVEEYKWTLQELSSRGLCG
jgi:hypothetical protein